MIAITNGRFFQNGTCITGQTVFIEKGSIAGVGNQDIPNDCTVVDAAGAYIQPGLIDLQIYGSGGNLFSAYPSRKTLQQMDMDLISKGTTGFLACVATNSPEVVWQSIQAAKDYRNEAVGFLGLHLEGPFLNVKRRGAHVPEYIHKANIDEVKLLMEHADGVVKMMTVAAELQDDEVISYLLDHGVILSLGHSDASYEEAIAAYNKGFKTTTHLFNAMPSIHHRAPNLPMGVFDHPAAMASIIADGEHVNFAMVRMSHRLMGNRLFLITDAVTGCDVGPYQHRLSGNKFITPDGTLSGSSITLVQAVQNCVEHCGISLSEALDMASAYPARLMEIPGRTGRIERGCRADLVLIDEDFKLKKVFAGGVEFEIHML